MSNLNAANVPGNGTATFAVAFVPVALGTRTAALHVTSNDPDESPFDITLTGVGLTRQEGWWQQYFQSTANSGNGADVQGYDFDGLTNFVEFCLKSDPTRSSPFSQSLIRNGTHLEFTYTPPKPPS